MKITLISNPPSRSQKPDFPPLGLAYLGAVAHQSGHEVLLIDAGLFSISKIKQALLASRPDLIGITCWTIDRKMVWKLCAIIKEILPNTTLIVGGPHATLLPENIFRKTHASVVVMGEGENTFAELIKTLDNGKDLKSVAGLALKQKDGSIFYTSAKPPIQDINTIPYPYYEGFSDFTFSNYEGFALLPKPTAAVISSRGCAFDCNYCASVDFWGRQWRQRSVGNVLDELEWLIEKHNISSIYFFDDNFTVNKQRAIDICQGIINRGLNLKWSCCSHVKTISRDLLEAMKASGCISIDFGVESGSNKILENINKKQTADDIEKTFKLVHQAGISARSYLIVGSPGEDESTIDETIQLIGKIKPTSSIGASLMWLLPGTRIYKDAVANGFIDDDFWINSDDVPFNLQEHSLKQLQSLRRRLMIGIARTKGGIKPMIGCVLKIIYYKYEFLSRVRSWVPRIFR